MWGCHNRCEFRATGRRELKASDAPQAIRYHGARPDGLGTHPVVPPARHAQR
jgi:hypothetical protein